jgi:DNA polymerase-3 subunit beta
MELTCVRSDLKEAADTVRRVIPSKTPLQALTGILLVAEDGLALKATDLATWMVRPVVAKVGKPGVALMPAGLFCELVTNLPGEEVRISSLKTKNDLRLECGTFQATIKGMDPEEYPEIPSLEGVHVLPAEALKAALAGVVYATAADDTRPVLQGVHLVGNGETLTIEGADGFRLARRCMASEAVFEAILPGRVAREVARVIEGEVALGINESHVVFACSRAQVGSRLIEGRYPPTERIIPTEHALEVRCVAADLLAAVKAVQVFNEEHVFLNTQGGQFSISATGMESGDNLGTVEASLIQGQDMAIALCPRYLTDVLGVMKGETVTLQMQSPRQPMVLKTATEGEIHIIMPISAKR